MSLRDALTLMRPEHWVKNLFLLIPAFFAARLNEPPLLAGALLGFGAFCLVASAVYIINDVVDAPQDRNHPDKSRRPVAAGRVKKPAALTFAAVLLLIAAMLAFGLSQAFVLFCLLYLAVNLAYSFALKHIAIIDVSLIALGFLIRVFAGGSVTGVDVSQWLIVLTFLLALILGLAKRRGEYIIATEGLSFRKALEGYNLPFLDLAITVCSTVAVVAYLMYCFSPEVVERIGNDKIYFTALFVVVGILRYLQLTLVYNRTESPVRALISDVFLQVVLLCWIGAFVWLLYF